MKKILVIGLRYHSYTDEIVAELAGLGYSVSFHEIQPRSLFDKTLKVLAGALYRRRLAAHHARILRQERGNAYDVVLFIQVHQFSVANLEALRAQHAASRFVLYNWDSISNHDYRPYLHLFDKVCTFDPEDARALNVHHLPLFCVRAFQHLARREQQRNAIYFVGNIVSVQRYVAMRAFKAYCAREAIALDCFMACSPVVLFRLLRHGIVPLDVRFFSIPQPRFIAMIERATAVFDFANHKQSGYTMRTIENLCAGKKIITNNPRVLHEPFYSPDRLCVFTDLDFSAVKQFMARPIARPEETFAEFHIQNFLRRLLS